VSRNLVRLLVVHFCRSRFARPLLPKGVAVRKGEAAIIQTHRAVSNLSSFRPVPERSATIRADARRVKWEVVFWSISQIYDVSNNYKFDLSFVAAFTRRQFRGRGAEVESVSASNQPGVVD
jgi:hypothetical protein